MYNSEGIIECLLYASTLSTSGFREIRKSNTETEPIITYTPDNIGDIGYLQVNALVQPSSFAGNYVGTLMFDISLEIETTVEE